MATTGALTTPGTSSSASVNTLPSWYTQYGQNLTGAGLGVLQNVNNYQGAVDANGNPMPRVASLDGQQQRAIDQVGSNVGSWTPYLNNANTNFNQAGSSISTGQGTISGAMSPLGQMNGTLGQAGSYLNPAQSAIQAGGSTFDQNQMSSYMNPYVSNVVNEIARLGNQNLTENVLPNVNSTFVGAGQFGSTRNADFTNRAIRDNQATISGAQSQALMSAQDKALDAYAAEKNRQLASGGALGNLSSVTQGIASGYGNNANIQSNIGKTFADTGTQQAGLGTSQGNLAQLMQTLGINDVNSLLTTGALSQGVQQKGLDAAYQDFLDRRDYPTTTLGALSQILPNVSGRISADTQTESVTQDPPTDPFQRIADIIRAIGANNG